MVCRLAAVQSALGQTTGKVWPLGQLLDWRALQELLWWLRQSALQTLAQQWS